MFFAGLATVSTFAAAGDSQLHNLSTRGAVGGGDAVMIAGFVVSEAPKAVLVRAVGPALGSFGVTNFLEDPVLTLFDADGAEIAENDNWTTEQASVFAQVGAFSLEPGSRDAALFMPLPPGAYTARVTGADGGTGVALVEVYDVDETGGVSRLLNLSARAEVGVGDSVMIPGLVLGAGQGPRRLLVRAIGPSLAEFGVEGFLEDPFVSVLDAEGRVFAGNNNWQSPDAVSIAALAGQAGAFPLEDTASKDAALYADLIAGAYTLLVSGVGGGGGVALVEVFDVTPDGPPAEVSIAATDAVADESGADIAEVTVVRSGATTAPLLVKYSTTGTAFNGVDFLFLGGTLVIPAGETSATIRIVPVPDIATEPLESVTVSLFPNLGYTVTGNAEAQVNITSVPPLLYVAALRTETTAASSTGYGTATILLSASGTIASVNATVANLSSPQTVAYLRLGQPGETGDPIHELPNGQISGSIWTLDPTGIHSAGELLNALRNGLIFLAIETVNFPSGELRGNFIQTTGSTSFVPPPSPPAAADASTDIADASRFLTQTTFGPKRGEVDALMDETFGQWIDEQMAIPASSHRAATAADWVSFPTNGRAMNTRPGREHRQSAWWQIVLQGEDQLRQRVAFALSEIFVVSDENALINNWQEGAAGYYDILVDEAFGNYRSLLERVSLSPIMGAYLSHLRNAKGDPETGALADENFAREIMQLLSIGLVELQPDGTLKLDAHGLPISTYDQTTISETAKVFTGWAYHTGNPADNLFRRGAPDFFEPMSLFPGFHDDGPKTIVGGVQIPAGQGGVEDLEMTLDTLFHHPNTAPFISRRLIQRLVTSNPSPGYVYRVAHVFEDNGAGVRGDLRAVIRAILLDYEARDPLVAENAGAGKLREPLLRLTNLLRAFDAEDTNDGRFNLTNPQNQFSQAALNSPTVFNFFEPDYVQTGPLAAAGLFAPEYQILTSSSALTIANALYSHIFATPSGIRMGTAPLLPLLDEVPALLEELSQLLAGGALSQDSRDTIAAALEALPSGTSDVNLIRTAIYLVINCPDAAIQR